MIKLIEIIRLLDRNVKKRKIVEDIEFILLYVILRILLENNRIEFEGIGIFDLKKSKKVFKLELELNDNIQKLLNNKTNELEKMLLEKLKDMI